MTGTRHLPVPISMPTGKIGAGHLLPQLRVVTHPAGGFVQVPGGMSVEHGMVAFLGSTVTPDDMVARWESEVGAIEDRNAALATLTAYTRALAHLKIGNVIQARYDGAGFAGLLKIQDGPPPSSSPLLPE
jgi:hypothetical protein